MAPPRKRRSPRTARVLLRAVGRAAGGAHGDVLQLWFCARGDANCDGPSPSARSSSLLDRLCRSALRERVVRPLQTMANLLTALREGDFSTRGRGANRDEPLGDVLAEINYSAAPCKTALGALEATALLRPSWRRSTSPSSLRRQRDAPPRQPRRSGTHRPAGRAHPWPGREGPRPGRLPRWGRHARAQPHLFRRHGPLGHAPHRLPRGGCRTASVVIADLSQPLREEELKAWQLSPRHRSRAQQFPRPDQVHRRLADLDPQAPASAAVDWEGDMRVASRSSRRAPRA